MSSYLAATPKPPYYAVIFSAIRGSSAGEEYVQMAEDMLILAAQQPGFLGVEQVHSETGWGMTISYWKDRESIQAWREQEQHRTAQERGRKEWYQNYRIRIAVVEQEISWDHA